MRALIANADDFGLSPGVNAGILKAYREGIVRSASLVVTAPSAEAAARQGAEAGLDLGLHLNLTTGRPICPAGQVPSLVRPDGRFHTLGGLVLRLALGLVRGDEVERELHAQLDRTREMGVRSSHLNTHHHVHVHPLVASAALRLAEAEGFALRCPTEPPQARAPRDLARGLLLWLPAWRLRRQARALGVSTTQHFRGISLGYGFNASALRAGLTDLPEGLTELMCHPGYPDAELAEATTYTRGRERELAALIDPGVRAWLGERGVRLLSWSEAHSLSC